MYSFQYEFSCQIFLNLLYIVDGFSLENRSTDTQINSISQCEGKVGGYHYGNTLTNLIKRRVKVKFSKKTEKANRYQDVCCQLSTFNLVKTAFTFESRPPQNVLI